MTILTEYLLSGLQFHHTMSKRGGGLKKTCPACQEKIFNGFKMCPNCKAPQPKNLRLKKKIENFEQNKNSWLEKSKRNQVISHLLDDAVILIEKLHAVGWRPLLLLEYPHKKPRLILPKDLALGTNAQTCVKNIYEIFKIMVEGNTNQATESSQEPEEATLILHLETLVNPSAEQVSLDQGAETIDNTESDLSHPTGQDFTAAASLDQGAGTMNGTESDLSSPTGQDFTAVTSLEQETGTIIDRTACDLSLLPTGQDLNAMMCLDQEAGTTDDPESSLNPLPTGQDFTTVMDQEPGTMVDPEPYLNLPPTGRRTRQIRRKKVGTKQKECPHNNWEVHPYKDIIQTRQRKGKTEHLYDWMPCKLCGKTWPPTWEAA
ncbi:uncharacterized protein [Paramisgurnus dabryanus]|uniref:uncharacterized protein isoform X2 n=1 Tax=Paramisgurnus dabryanus TaxID=90735 RepID=UPI0031F39197